MYAFIYTYMQLDIYRATMNNVFNTHQRLANKTPSGRNGIGLHLLE